MEVPWFIEAVAATPAEVEALVSFGADTPRHLYEALRLAPRETQAMLGSEARSRVMDGLARLSPAVEPLPASAMPYGVPLGRQAPDLPPPRFEIDRRDALFSRLQAARDAGAPEHDIHALEAQLDAMLPR